MTLPVWRDIALVFLIIQAFILALIPGLIFYFGNKGLHSFITWLRRKGMPKAQQYSALVASETKRYSQMVITPVVILDSEVTRAKQTLGAVPHILKHRKRRRFHVGKS
ncbi:MAG: hypothetical protein GXP38_00680 [Chloroflexi bacterium]|nr:hypothetical protein [Chloroflexota bacterium]